MTKEALFADRNLKGQDLEKKGNVSDAIKLYELNIKDKADTPFTYSRLAILYHKQDRLDDEIAILEEAVASFPWEDKFKLRLQKAEAKRGE